MQSNQIGEALKSYVLKQNPNTVVNEVYFNRYVKFISERQRSEKFENSERHHIVPQCLFTEEDVFKNSNINLTYLSFREHFIAHLLLWKAFPNNSKLIFAANMMLSRNTKETSSRTYDTLRKEHAKINSAVLKEAWSKPEIRKKQSIKQKKRFEKPSERKVLSENTKVLWADDDFRARMMEKQLSPETRKKKSEGISKALNREGSKEQRSAQQKEVWKDEGLLERHSKNKKKFYESEENRRKASEYQKKRFENLEELLKLTEAMRNPETNAKRSKNLKEFNSTEEGKRIRKEAGKKAWSNPKRNAERLAYDKSEENRERHRQLTLKHYSNPENRKKQSDRQKEFLKTTEGRISELKRRISWNKTMFAKNPHRTEYLDKIELLEKELERA